MKRKIMEIAALLTGAVLLGGCSDDQPDYEAPASAAVSVIEPVDVMLNTQSYEGEEAKPEETVAVFASDDGRCIIEKKPSYYEVYLDYSDGDYQACGKAYAEAILKIDMDLTGILEPYLYENINMAFPNLDGNFTPVEDRINELIKKIPGDYVKEMEAFAREFSEGRTGMESDGFISYEEALLCHMVPDCLRETSCNAFSVWGEKSTTGERIVSRTLEWPQGSEYQMCMAHAVTHFQMPAGKNSYTTFGVLGLLDMLTGLNDKGVFAGILDAGSDGDYICEGKKCYTYELRYALENMSDARSVGDYMVAESKNFTFSHNIIITDKKDCFVAEDCVEPAGKSALRDKDTPLMDNVCWDNPDSLCVVNAFVTEGSEGIFTMSGSNYTRFCKYNTWAGEKEKLSLADVKEIVTRERTEHHGKFQKLYSENVYHIITYDYASGELDICFTGTEGIVNHPVFTRIENTMQ